MRTALAAWVGVAALAVGPLAPGTAGAVTVGEPRDVRVVLYPVKLVGERVPGPAALERVLRRLSADVARISYGRLRVTGAVAPTYPGTTRSTPQSIIPHATLDAAVASAAAQGVRTDGAIPLFIAPSRVDKLSFANSTFAVVQGRGLTRPGNTVAHELAHVLGLDHASGATVCPRPFRPASCALAPAQVYEYGDLLDLMGLGEDRLGAYHLAVLGLAPVRDAPPGRARVAVRPLQRPQPTLLRLRTATHDWFVESRTSAATRDTPRATRLPRGVAIARVRARYLPDDRNRVPRPVRLAATPPTTPCSSAASCLRRQIFRPGRILTVAGAFRLRVLGAGPQGSTLVATTWLDRVPPSVSIAGATVVRRFGGGAELVLDLRARAAGAGVASVVVDQGGAVTRVDPDTVPGLVAGADGAGIVRVPLAAGAASATVRLVDAAGNPSAPARVDLGAVPALAGATVVFDPPTGSDDTRATPLPAGRTVTVSGVTDPSFAGFGWRLDIIGTQVSLDLPIGPGGTFSGSWTPSEPGLYRVVATVPVERIPGSVELRRQTTDGWVRA